MTKIKPDPDAWIRICERMLEADDYDYASDTIEGIRDYVVEHNRITKKQITAIQNIRRGADRL